MASIVIKLGNDPDEKAEVLHKKIVDYLSESDLGDRTGVVGPLCNPHTNDVCIMVWGHDSIASKFHKVLEQFFFNDEIGITVREFVKGLPEKSPE